MCSVPFIIIIIVSAIGYLLFGVPGLLGGVLAVILILTLGGKRHGHLGEGEGHSYEGPYDVRNNY